jgi:hypothetical protein
MARLGKVPARGMDRGPMRWEVVLLYRHLLAEGGGKGEALLGRHFILYDQSEICCSPMAVLL